jgi:hypothetical protein
MLAKASKDVQHLPFQFAELAYDVGLEGHLIPNLCIQACNTCVRRCKAAKRGT